MGLGKKCTSGSGDPDSPKAPRHFLCFMSNTPNAEAPIQGPAQLLTLQLPTDGAPVKDYASNLHFAICEVLRLVFEHRDLDLEENQTYALNVLSKLLADLAVVIADPDGLEDEKYREAVETLRQRFPDNEASEG